MTDQPPGYPTRGHAAALSDRAQALYLRLKTVAWLIKAAPPVTGPTLLWRDDQDVVQTHPVRGSLLIGRDPACDLVFGSQLVSRRHCRIWPENGMVWVEDLDSTHGTIVGGLPASRQPLRDGDLIDLGGAALAFVGMVAEP